MSRLAVVVAVAGLGLSALASGPALAYTQPSNVKAECPAPAASTFECMALVRSDLTPSMSGPVGGYGPSDLRSAYNLTSAAASGGSGTTVAIIEEGDDPNVVSDFNAYRAQYGLPACDTTTEAGCLTVDDAAATQDSQAWSVQTSMDAETVAAICPSCHVLLVQAHENTLLGSMGRAAAPDGARVVVLGFGEPDTSLSLWSSALAKQGVAVVAAAGDGGYGTQFPASSQFITAVGGTTLTRDASSARGWDESVWAGTGAGCSTDQIKPLWQSDTGCADRTQNDVAADADPATGVAFYDTDGFGGWGEGGGTNVSAAIIAGVYALAGPAEGYTYPARYPYQAAGGLYPVTSGSDGTCTTAYLCTAGSGYTGPAGLGTPDGTAAFTPPSGDGITLFALRLGSFTTGSGSMSDAFDALDPVSTSGMTFSSSGLPAGLALTTTSCATGNQVCPVEITGIPTVQGDYSATITATDADGTAASITVPIHVQDVVTAPSPYEDIMVGNSVNVQYNATSAAGQPLNFSVTGLPTGVSYTKTGPEQITFTGTPAAGKYSTTVTATNPNGGSATGTITWAVHGTISITPISNRTSMAGSYGGFPTPATDSVKGASLSYFWTGLPTGINGGTSTAGTTGTPTSPGTYRVDLSVEDQYGATASDAFTWTVTSSGAAVSGPIRLDLAGKCLDDPASKTANGTRIDIWTCNGGANQKWTLMQDGTVRIFGKCLDAEAGNGSTYGAPVDLSACNGLTNQQWLVNARGYLVADYLVPSTCLDDPAFKTVNGTKLNLWNCDGGKNQRWTAPAGPVMPDVFGKCMDDKGASTANGTVIDSYACNAGANQRWTFEPDGTVRVAGKCLDIKGASKSVGAKADLYACNGGANQQWEQFQDSNITYPLLENPVSGLCLAVPGDSTANGVQLQMAKCNEPDPGQEWRVW